MTPVLRIEQLQKSFGGVRAIDNVTLDFEPRSLSAIIGPNGAGKTTLFNLITGHLRPDAGRIVFNGADLVGLDPTAVVRRGVGRAFQVANVFSSFSVEEALAAAVLSYRRKSGQMLTRFPTKAVRARAEEIMELLDLVSVRRIRASNLSHGDQKLLDIGLALALEPRILLLDEPTAGMGSEERWKMIEKVHELWRADNLTVAFIEHDMDIVFRIAQTITVLKYGEVLAQGTPDEIRRNQDVVDAYLGTDHHALAGEGTE